MASEHIDTGYGTRRAMQLEIEDLRARLAATETALAFAEASLHSWAILNTHTDPRESQRMGQRALDRFRVLVAEPAAEETP